jgi:small-conductance mechanosensitive channel
LRLTAAVFAAVVVLELVGKKTLAVYLFVSFIRSTVTIAAFMLFLRFLHGSVAWVFRSSPLRRVAVVHSDDTDTIIQRVTRLLDIVIWGVVLLSALLLIWGVYDSLQEAMQGLLALGFTWGQQHVSVGLLLASTSILYGSFFVSWIAEKLLVDDVLFERRLERGVRLSIARLAHYGILFVGFLLALSALGFDVTKLTIMVSALGVGIGFGLQDVVKNFISGLILLFERPVRVGDSIEVGGKWAEIKKIGLRATLIKTTDEADVIIPNSDLIVNQVTNWTLSNRLVRVTLPVGVAYGSDVPKVLDTLKACALAHAMVANTPTPQVLFLCFGESTLDFELRVWVFNADDRFTVLSELHQDIDRRFRKAQIEIAFPQRDLHLRSVDESILHLRKSDPCK